MDKRAYIDPEWTPLNDNAPVEKHANNPTEDDTLDLLDNDLAKRLVDCNSILNKFRKGGPFGHLAEKYKKY